MIPVTGVELEVDEGQEGEGEGGGCQSQRTSAFVVQARKNPFPILWIYTLSSFFSFLWVGLTISLKNLIIIFKAGLLYTFTLISGLLCTMPHPLLYHHWVGQQDS